MRIRCVMMDEISHCNLAVRGLLPNASYCALAGGQHVPMGDRLCLRDRAAYRSTVQAMKDYEKNDGDPVGGVREFVANGLIQRCAFLSEERFRAWAVDNL